MIPYTTNEKIKIIFLFQAASIWPSWESFYKACNDDSDVDARILLTKPGMEKTQMYTAKDFLDNKGIPYEEFECFDIDSFRPHVVFMQFPYDVAFRRSEALSLHLKKKGIRIAYIPYGLEISDEEEARSSHFENFVVENCKWIFTSSTALQGEYYKYCRNREAVRVCGSPKFDGFSHIEDFQLSSEIEEKSVGRKIVLWKIHFPKKYYVNHEAIQITPELDEYIAFAKKLEQYNNFFFIIMPHPRMLHKMSGGDIKGDTLLQEKSSQFIEAVRGNDNVFLDISDDYRPSLYHADAIIMDRSALVVEAAMTGKPVLFMKNAFYEERWTSGVHQVVETFQQGSRAIDMENFLQKLDGKDNLQNQDGLNFESLVKTREAINKYFPYQDGQCGARILELIRKELKEEYEVQMGHKKKIILYGAGGVCRYYLEEEKLGSYKGILIEAIADGNTARHGEEFCGYKIISPEKLLTMHFDALIIMTELHYYEIKKKLVYEMFLDERKIWRLDAWMEEISGL